VNNAPVDVVGQRTVSLTRQLGSTARLRARTRVLVETELRSLPPHANAKQLVPSPRVLLLWSGPMTGRGRAGEGARAKVTAA
jgi:hypothetical protein